MLLILCVYYSQLCVAFTIKRGLNVLVRGINLVLLTVVAFLYT